jgi:hypothetical protein
MLYDRRKLECPDAASASLVPHGYFLISNLTPVPQFTCACGHNSVTSHLLNLLQTNEQTKALLKIAQAF